MSLISEDASLLDEIPKQNLVKKILLAEDDSLFRKSLSFYLRDQKYNICEVENGMQAIEEIKKNDFDLIITDLKMPFMSGMEIINIVRNELMLKTPVIVLTASNIESVELQSFSSGANEFIAKPFSPSVLKARILKLIG